MLILPNPYGKRYTFPAVPNVRVIVPRANILMWTENCFVLKETKIATGTAAAHGCFESRKKLPHFFVSSFFAASNSLRFAASTFG